MKADNGKNTHNYGGGVFTSGRKRALEPKMATKHPQRRRKTGANRAKRLANPGRREDNHENGKKQFIYAMNIKSNGKSTLNMKTMRIIFGFIPALAFGLAGNLKAQDLYVTGFDVDDLNTTVGEYGLDGSTLDASLITVRGSPWCTAISGGDLFMAYYSSGIVTEYTTSGHRSYASLFSGVHLACGMAASESDLFIATGNSIGEYTTDGAMVNATLISGLNMYPHLGLVVSGNHLFIPNNSLGTVAEYTTSGATVNTSLVSGLNGPAAIAISGNDLFVLNQGGGTVGEYGLDGSTINASLISGLVGAQGIAIYGNDLFVAAGGPLPWEPVPSANMACDGSIINAALISGLDDPFAISITPTPEPSAGMLAGLGAAALWLWRRCK